MKRNDSTKNKSSSINSEKLVSNNNDNNSRVAKIFGGKSTSQKSSAVLSGLNNLQNKERKLHIMKVKITPEVSISPTKSSVKKVG